MTVSAFLLANLIPLLIVLIFVPAVVVCSVLDSRAERRRVRAVAIRRKFKHRGAGGS